MYDLETQAKVQTWRRKAIDGTLSIEEQVEAVKYLSQGRRSASSAASTAKGTRAKATKLAGISGDDLLSEMMGDA